MVSTPCNVRIMYLLILVLLLSKKKHNIFESMHITLIVTLLTLKSWFVCPILVCQPTKFLIIVWMKHRFSSALLIYRKDSRWYLDFLIDETLQENKNGKLKGMYNGIQFKTHSYSHCSLSSYCPGRQCSLRMRNTSIVIITKYNNILWMWTFFNLITILYFLLLYSFNVSQISYQHTEHRYKLISS